jgi:hypothetical protein
MTEPTDNYQTWWEIEEEQRAADERQEKRDLARRLGEALRSMPATGLGSKRWESWISQYRR